MTQDDPTEVRYRYLANVDDDYHFGTYQPGHKLVVGWEDTVEGWGEGTVEKGYTILTYWAERVFAANNRDDRPNGRTCRSMSVGDVAVFDTPDGSFALACETFGWKEVAVPSDDAILDGTWVDVVRAREVRR